MEIGARVPRVADFIFCLLVAIDLTHDSQCSILRARRIADAADKSTQSKKKKKLGSLIRAWFFY